MLLEEHKTLQEIVLEMSPTEVGEVVEFARSLLQKRAEPVSPLYDPDDLTDEDLEAIAIDSMRRFDEEHPDDDWGYDNMIPEKNNP